MRLFTHVAATLLLLLLMVIGSRATAQVDITNDVFGCPDFIFGPDFNTLPAAPTSWANNTTLTGWYISGPPINYGGANNGTINAGGYYSYGTAPGERALGMQPTGTFPNPRLGFRMRNTTPNNIYSIGINFNLEQWRRANNGNVPNTVFFEYLQGVTVTNVSAPGPWTSVPLLDGIAPQNSPVCNATGIPLDGNEVFPTNNQLNFSQIIDLLNPIGPGEEIMFRWSFPEQPGCTDHAMAIDDMFLFPLNYPFNQDPATDQFGAITGNATVCPGGPQTYSVIAYPDLTYDWQVDAPLSISSGNGTNLISVNVPIATPPGTYSVQVSASNPSCGTSLPETFTITVNSGVTADAGLDQTVCINTPATLTGNNPSPGTGVWTQVAGPASTITPTGTQLAVSGLAAVGTYTYQWTITQATCPPNSDNVNISVTSAPAGASVVPKANICISSPTTTIQANPPTIGTGVWSAVSHPTATPPIILTPNALTSNVFGLNLPGTYTFRWTVSRAPCTGTVTADLVFNVIAQPTIANGGPGRTICDPASITLDGNTPTNGTAAWAYIGHSDLLAPAPTTNQVGDDFQVSNMTTGGTYTFQYSIANAPCTPSFDVVDVIVGISSAPANAGADVSLCGATATTLIGSDPTPNIGFWTYNFNGPANPTTNQVGNTFLITNLFTPGTYSFTWNIFNTPNAACPNQSDVVAVTVFATPSIANAGIDQTLCNDPNGLLVGNVPVSGTPMWSIVSQPPTGVAVLTPLTSNATVTGMTVPGTYTFAYIISNGNCTPTVDQVVITILPPPTTPDAGIDQFRCITTTTANLTGNVPAVGETGFWSFAGGPAVPAVAQTGNSATVTGLTQAGCYSFAWTISRPGCNPEADVVEVCIEPQPTTAAAGTDQSLCNLPGVFVTGNTPVFGTGDWSIVTGPVGSTIVTAGNVGTINGPSGVYTLRWSISNPPCTDSFDDVQATLTGPPTTANAGIDQTFCQGSTTSVTLAGNAPTVGIGGWFVMSQPIGSPVVAFSNANSTTSTASNLTFVGTYRFGWAIVNPPCAPSFDAMDVIITTPSIAGIITGPAGPVCSGNNSTTLNLVGTTGTITQWETSSNGFVTRNTLPTTAPSQTFTNLTLGIQVRAIVQNGICAPDTSAVFTIQITQASIGGTLAYTPGNPSTCASVVNGSYRLDSYFGSILRWESSSDNFATAAPIANTTRFYTHGTLNQTTCFRAVVQSGNCPAVFSEPHCVTVQGLGVLNIQTVSGCSNAGSMSTLVMDVNGGAAPFDFFFIPTLGVKYNDNTFVNVPNGTYTVYARDANFCYLFRQITLNAGPVEPPILTGYRNLRSDRATPEWTPVSPSNGVRYQIRYGLSPAGPWINTFTSINPRRALTGLTANTTYYFQLRTRCSNNTFSAWSTSYNFMTSAFREEAQQAASGLGEISLYPNPSRGQVSLEIATETAGITKLEVRDILGRLVSQQELTLTEGSNSFSFDFAHLQAGVYLLNLKKDGIERPLKLIIE